MLTKHRIAQITQQALTTAQREQALPDVPIDDIPIERPQNPDHGDFATSLPLKLARPMRMSPLRIADAIATRIPPGDLLANATVAPPGFINFALQQNWLLNQVDAIRSAGPTFGDIPLGNGEPVQIEFVSANPVGPLHIAHARGGVLGSALANILQAAGYQVTREYYFNDAGAQIGHFQNTLYARYQQQCGIQAELPPDAYQAEYMIDLAAEIHAEQGDSLLSLSQPDALARLGEIGLAKFMSRIRQDVALLRVQFDEWFNEATLFQNGQFNRALDLLNQRGYIARRDGATWFASTALGDEKDKVMIRANGIPTYFASDVAYHYNKFFERQFHKVINIWGADHQGHAPFMKAMVAALGLPQDKLTLIINQLVTLKRGGEIVRISKRSGDIITLREVIDEVGPDACRYFFLSRDANSQMEFDLDLAKRQSQENPVYYIQYAHARIASILRLAADRNINHTDADLTPLTHPTELALIRKMLALPEIIDMMARSLEAHHLPHYAYELATAFHLFYQNCRVVSAAPEDAALTKARLKLAEATQITLARCLSLMIMDAPQSMQRE